MRWSLGKGRMEQVQDSGAQTLGWFCKLPRNDAEDLWAHRRVHVSGWSQGDSAAGPFCVDLALGWTSNLLIIIEWFIKCFSRCCSTFCNLRTENLNLDTFIYLFYPFLLFSFHEQVPWACSKFMFMPFNALGSFKAGLVSLLGSQLDRSIQLATPFGSVIESFGPTKTYKNGVRTCNTIHRDSPILICDSHHGMTIPHGSRAWRHDHGTLVVQFQALGRQVQNFQEDLWSKHLEEAT